MKSNFLNAVALVLSMSLLSTTCSSDDDNSSNSNAIDSEILSSIVVSDDWRISSMLDSGEDETSDFNNFIFSFDSDGTLTATSSAITLTGTWSISDSSSSSSSSSSDDDLDFNIAFPVADDHDFDDLNDDWDVVSFNESEIRLIDISGGDGDTDTLVFVKL
jgi:hypothetical protein